MKKYFLLLAFFLLAGCTPDQTQKMVSPPKTLPQTTQKIATQLTEQKPIGPQRYSLASDVGDLIVELPIDCQASPSEPSWFFDLKSKNELSFTDCAIGSDAPDLVRIALQDQESITTGIDNYIARNGEEVCIDGPETCYKEDWNSQKKIISIEKNALHDTSLPKNYDFNSLIGSFRYLLETKESKPSGQSLRNYITYRGDKRIVITFMWNFEQGSAISLKERYRKDTDEFMRQIHIEIL